MNERVKMIREALGLSAPKFGEKIGVTSASIYDIEKGRNKVSNQIIKTLEVVFNVNQEWLKTGQGDMFLPHEEPYKSPFPEGSNHDKIIQMCLKLSDEQLDLVIQLLKQMKQETPPSK